MGWSSRSCLHRFAIVAVVSPNYADDSIFSIVFCVVLLSLLFQGALLPSASKHLNMIDEHENVLKTFNDYTDENNIHFTCLELNNSHPWINKQIRDIGSIPGTLIAAILRKGYYNAKRRYILARWRYTHHLR